MLPFLRPSRPTYPQSRPQRTLGPYQHTRQVYDSPPPPPKPTTLYDPAAPPSPGTASSAPRSQLEAMPPHPPLSPAMQIPYNPAFSHPVFFAPGWHRPPMSLMGGCRPVGSETSSPIAAGYVWPRREAGDAQKPKL